MRAATSIPTMPIAQSPRIAQPAGPWTTFWTALLSFGLWPLFRWPTMWRQFVELDRPRQINRAEAVRRVADDKQRRKIDRAMSGMTHIPILAAAPTVALGVAGLIILLLFGSGAHWSEIWLLAYHPDKIPRWPISQHMLQFHTTWLTLLCVGFGCQWFVVRRYVFAVKDLDRAVGQRSLPRSHGGPGFKWVLAAIPLCALGAWWAIPMVLAGSVQRRYSKLREFVSAPAAPDTVRFCETKGCGLRLMDSAKFCPRCGAATFT